MARVSNFKAMKSGPSPQKSLEMLTKVVKMADPVMKKYSMVIGTLQEFYPSNTSLVGMNKHKGFKIYLRLRCPSNKNSFLPLDEILDTLLHELAHNVHPSHGTEFWDFLETIIQDLKDHGRQIRGGDNPQAPRAPVKMTPFMLLQEELKKERLFCPASLVESQTIEEECKVEENSNGTLDIAGDDIEYQLGDSERDQESEAELRGPDEDTSSSKEGGNGKRKIEVISLDTSDEDSDGEGKESDDRSSKKSQPLKFTAEDDYDSVTEDEDEDQKVVKAKQSVSTREWKGKENEPINKKSKITPSIKERSTLEKNRASVNNSDSQTEEDEPQPTKKVKSDVPKPSKYIDQILKAKEKARSKSNGVTAPSGYVNPKIEVGKPFLAATFTPQYPDSTLPANPAPVQNQNPQPHLPAHLAFANTPQAAALTQRLADLAARVPEELKWIAGDPQGTNPEWKCNKCTLTNIPDSIKCSACGEYRPGASFMTEMMYDGWKQGKPGFQMTPFGIVLTSQMS